MFAKLYDETYIGVGDLVYISKYASHLNDQNKKLFKKGYKASFTKEIYKVSKVWRGDPNLYLVDHENNEPIFGRFYAQELALVK